MTKKHSSQTEWFVNLDDNLWLKPDDSGQEEADFIKRALRLRKGQSVLDAPCGAARVTVHLAEAGCLVTGIDLREPLIRRARKRFRKKGLCGSFKAMDLRKLDSCAEFHAAFNWSGSFGYFSDTENLDVLKRLARALRPGGRLLIDQPNREHILRHFRRTDQRGNVKLATRWCPETQRVETTWTLPSRGRLRSCTSSIRLYALGQFQKLLAQAGLHLDAVYGDLDGSKYRRGSRRMHLVARKIRRGS